jgi:hypothetical protein
LMKEKAIEWTNIDLICYMNEELITVYRHVVLNDT